MIITLLDNFNRNQMIKSKHRDWVHVNETMKQWNKEKSAKIIHSKYTCAIYRIRIKPALF